MALRFRRPLALLIPALLVPLAACGETEQQTAPAAEAFEVTEAADGSPEVEWNAVLEPGEKVVETISEGDGEAVAKGDRVLVNALVSNGFTHRSVIDSYGDKESGGSLVVGEDFEPRVYQGRLLQPSDLVVDVLADEIKAGTKIGTRISVAVGAEEAFGDYASGAGALGIGNEDGLVFVFDIVGKALDAPSGKDQDPPAWAPSLVEKKGEPTGLTFDGLTKPDPKDKLRVATLVKGDGEKVAKGDFVVVDYLGQVHGGDAPFDESFSSDEPISAAIGEGVEGISTSVVKGWSRGLTGVTVGSRVIIQIPPRLGYGAQGNQGAGIGGDDTMYFVVDVLGAA